MIHLCGSVSLSIIHNCQVMYMLHFIKKYSRYGSWGNVYSLSAHSPCNVIKDLLWGYHLLEPDLSPWSKNRARDRVWVRVIMAWLNQDADWGQGWCIFTWYSFQSDKETLHLPFSFFWGYCLGDRWVLETGKTCNSYLQTALTSPEIFLITGYVRLSLLIASWTTYLSHSVLSISLYCISTLLDGECWGNGWFQNQDFTDAHLYNFTPYNFRCWWVFS